MKFEYFINPETNDRHIHDHDVFEKEIREAFLECDCLTIERKDGSSVDFCKLKSGRYLKIIYRKLSKVLYYIITAFDLEDQHIRNLLDQESNK